MRKKIVIAIIVLVLIAGGGIAWFMYSPASTNLMADSTSSNPGFIITPNDRTIGNPKAPVTLIEYAALVCPHCAAFYMENFPTLKANYIDTGKVFYVFRIYPIRPGDGPAEKLASCLPADKYFNVTDLLFRNQPKWDGDEYPGVDVHAGLIQMARIAGLSAEQADKCMNDTSSDAAINQVGQDGVQRYNLTGTPTFIVDGMPGPAGEEWSGLQQRLDAALAAKKVKH